MRGHWGSPDALGTHIQEDQGGHSATGSTGRYWDVPQEALGVTERALGQMGRHWEGSETDWEDSGTYWGESRCTGYLHPGQKRVQGNWEHWVPELGGWEALGVSSVSTGRYWDSLGGTGGSLNAPVGALRRTKVGYSATRRLQGCSSGALGQIGRALGQSGRHWEGSGLA